ncbi:MAG TPA: ferritin-like domain-containing protein [Gemmatimonadales bacterium]|nr:ferritin-like domain-containing protein [Gemmatimonadales bacterium]
MALETLRDLLVHELRDIYNAEQQIIKALPRMVKAAENPTLAQALQTHLRETEEQVVRLERVFEEMGVPARGKKCKGMEGLIEEGKEILEEEGGAAVIDAALIGAAQKVEHYEIAAYGTVKSMAELLGLQQVVQLLDQTLQEEMATDELLTHIAEGQVNEMALQAGSEPEATEAPEAAPARRAGTGSRGRAQR